MCEVALQAARPNNVPQILHLICKKSIFIQFMSDSLLRLPRLLVCHRSEESDLRSS